MNWTASHSCGTLLLALASLHAADDSLTNLSAFNDRLTVHPRVRVGGRADSNPTGSSSAAGRETEWAGIGGAGCGANFSWSEQTTIRSDADINAVLTNRDATRQHLEGGALLGFNRDLGLRQSSGQIDWRRATDPDLITGERVLSDIFHGSWSEQFTREQHRFATQVGATRTLYQQTATTFDSASRNGNSYNLNLGYGFRTTRDDDVTVDTGVIANRYDRPDIFQNSNSIFVRGGWTHGVNERTSWNASLGVERRWYQATNQTPGTMVTGPSWLTALNFIASEASTLSVHYSGGLTDGIQGQAALQSTTGAEYSRILNELWTVQGTVGANQTRDLQAANGSPRDVQTNYTIGVGATRILRPGVTMAGSLSYQYYQSLLTEPFQRVAAGLELTATF